MLEDFSLALQITLVADNNHGEVVLVLDSQNLLLESGDFLETLARCDGVDEQETFTRAHVLLSHGAVLLLAGGIEDVEKGDFIVNDTLLAVRVCTSGRAQVSESCQWCARTTVMAMTMMMEMVAQSSSLFSDACDVANGWEGRECRTYLQL